MLVAVEEDRAVLPAAAGGGSGASPPATAGSRSPGQPIMHLLTHSVCGRSDYGRQKSNDWAQMFSLLFFASFVVVVVCFCVCWGGGGGFCVPFAFCISVWTAFLGPRAHESQYSFRFSHMGLLHCHVLLGRNFTFMFMHVQESAAGERISDPALGMTRAGCFNANIY